MAIYFLALGFSFHPPFATPRQWWAQKGLISTLSSRKISFSPVKGAVLVSKIKSFYASNPLIRANRVQLRRAGLDPRAEIAFYWGFFGSNFAQMAPGGAESDFGTQGWITLGLEQIFSTFSAPISLQIHWGARRMSLVLLILLEKCFNILLNSMVPALL